MKFKYAATLEFNGPPPETLRGEVEAGSPGTACNKAVKALIKAYPHRKWSSLVVVLLERLDTTDETETDDSVDGPTDQEPDK